MVVLILATLSLVSCSRAPATLAATVTVDVRKEIGRVPKLLLGQNTEAGDNYGIFGNTHSYEVSRTGSGLWNPDARSPEPKMLQASKDAGMSILRFPGGCLTHNYDWKKAIGPV